MKESLEQLRNEYQEKFTAYLKAAEILENIDQEIFMSILKKAAGCKLMIEEYDRQLANFNVA